LARFDLRQRCSAALAVVLLLSSAAAPAEAILQRGNKYEPETLDPQKSDGYQEYWVQSDLFEGLTRVDAHGAIVPGIAESWDIAADGLTWTFHLRPDLKWSDGAPLTSEDLIWSLRRAVDPQTAASYASILYPIVNARAINNGQEKDLTTLGVTAPDARTVMFKLTGPTAYLDGVLTLSIAFPLPRKAIEAFGAEWTRPGHIVGNGAFVMDSWTPQSEIRMKRNPNYYDAAAVKLDSVVWSVNADDETALKRYRAGDLDIARVPRKLVPVLAQEMPGELHAGGYLATAFIIINTQRAPWSDVRLRQALSMLIDRETLAHKVDPRGQAPAYTLVPPGIEGYAPQAPDWIGKSPAERQELAKTLLQEAGYGPSNPVHIEIIYPADDSGRRQLAAIASMVKPYGIDVDAQAEETQVVESTTRNHDFQASLYGWIADYPDPWTFLSPYRSDGGGLNTPDYRSAEYDALLAKAETTLDPAARDRLLEAAEKQFARDAPILPVNYNNDPRVVSPKVSGYFDNSLNLHASRDMALTR
jgi:oligopeptide transport system substrate-binding protein